MAWGRLVPGAWFTAYLVGFALMLVGLALLGERAVEGDGTAGAALASITGLVAAWLAAVGRKRMGAKGV